MKPEEDRLPSDHDVEVVEVVDDGGELEVRIDLFLDDGTRIECDVTFCSLASSASVHARDLNGRPVLLTSDQLDAVTFRAYQALGLGL